MKKVKGQFTGKISNDSKYINGTGLDEDKVMKDNYK